MKTISIATQSRTNRASLSRVQAHNRELYRFDFQLAMDLIGAELRRLRLDQGLTIPAVARALRMRKYRIALIEHGLYVHFDVHQIRRMATHYGVSHLQVLDIVPDTLFSKLN